MSARSPWELAAALSVLGALLGGDEGIARLLRILVQIHLERETLLEAVTVVDVARLQAVQRLLRQGERATALGGDEPGKGARFLEKLLGRHQSLYGAQTVRLRR